MGDIPKHLRVVRELEEGGQGFTHVVCRTDGSDTAEFVLKRLKNPKRQDQFDNEIQAYSTLDHPNVLKLVEHGKTPGGRPYLLTPYCSGDSLEHQPPFTSPGDGLRFFRKVADAIRYAHSQQHPVYHLDLKPANILLRGSDPVVGDFGICFIDSTEVTFTKEGHRGSLHYCAPELRNPKLTDTSRLATADIYSLGKLLYWLFTNDVYDGHEDDYDDPERKLAGRFSNDPHFRFIDELVEEMVKKNPASRVKSTEKLLSSIDERIHRIQKNARVLDLRIPQHCLYCATGHYRPGHEKIPTGHVYNNITFPDIATRKNPPQETSVRPSTIYEKAKYVAEMVFGLSKGRPSAPLILICDYCGNIQYFRLDYTDDGKGLNWLP